MPYVVNPKDFTQPTNDKGATQGAEEFRALKELLVGRTPVSVKDYPFKAKGDGVANDRNAIRDAIDSVGDVGTIYFPDGIYLIGNTQLDWTGKRGIRFTGPGTLNHSGNLGVEIRWTGGAGSGPAILTDQAQAIEFDHLALRATDATYDGNLFDTGGVAGGVQTALVEIHNSRFGAGAAARRLVRLGNTFNVDLHHNVFDGGQEAVSGDGSNSVVSLFQNYFAKTCLVSVAARSGAWNLISNTHQQDPAIALRPFLTLAGECNGINVIANLLGVDGADPGTAATASIIDLTGQKSSGVNIIANLFGSTAGTGIRGNTTNPADTQGLVISGNTFFATPTAFRLEKADTVTIGANRWGASVKNYGTATNVFEHIELTWNPVITNTVGAYTTTAVNYALATILGREVVCQMGVTVSNSGTAAGDMNFTLPIAALQGGYGCGRENVTTGDFLIARVFGGTSQGRIQKINGGSLGGLGTYEISFSYPWR